MKEVNENNKENSNEKTKNSSNENTKKNNSLTFIKKHPKITILGIVVLIVLIIILINGIFYSEKGKILIEVKSTKEKVVDKNELRTVTYTFNGIAKQCEKECKNNDEDEYLYFVFYKGTVTAGIDFNSINYKVENKKLIISIPAPIITGQNVQVGDFKYIFIDDDYNVPSEINEVFKLCEEDLKSRTQKDELILSTAKENAINVVKQFYEQWLKKNYPDYELVVE